MVDLLIHDAEHMVLEALTNLLLRFPDLTIVGTTDTIESAEKCLTTLPSCDVAVVDLGAGAETHASLALCRWIRDHRARTKVLLLASTTSDQLTVDAHRAGAAALVQKSGSAAELVDAIRDVAAGMVLIDRDDVRDAATRLERDGHTAWSTLSATDRQIMRCLAEGMNDKEIAQSVHLSTQTVRNHVSLLLRTFGRSNRTQLALLAAGRSSEPGAGPEDGATPGGPATPPARR
jgi:DNA-binding NarL/FixJ family response regulator